MKDVRTTGFGGTLIAVSQSRDFLNGLTAMVYARHQCVREHPCGSHEFLETKKMEALQELERK